MSDRIELKADYVSGASLDGKPGEHKTYKVDVSFDGAPARLLVRLIVDADNKPWAVRMLRLVGGDGERLRTVDSVYTEDVEFGGPKP